ncbi:hypothetical protein LBMAG56_43010 [Verrucomicrobiota bacterium]|nr:hypothetical protein LBMAG56_43010 [Verrucomicrobiota bacterium]
MIEFLNPIEAEAGDENFGADGAGHRGGKQQALAESAERIDCFHKGGLLVAVAVD